MSMFMAHIPNACGQRGTRRKGFSLIELMVVIALLGVLLALAAPSMRDMIDVRRLRAINAQLVTDLQFARAEAITRHALVRMDFRTSDTHTCYTISTTRVPTVLCNCLAAENQACPAGPDAVELRTVSIPKSLRTQFTFVAPQHRRFGFEPTMGGLVTTPVDFNPLPLPEAWIEPAIDATKKFRIELLQSGRPAVCAPAGSKMDVTACTS